MTPQEMGRRSHKKQIEKYGGIKKYREEMKRRSGLRVKKDKGDTGMNTGGLVTNDKRHGNGSI